MASNAKLLASLGLDTRRFDRAIRGAKNRARGLSREFGKTGQGTRGFSQALRGLTSGRGGLGTATRSMGVMTRTLGGLGRAFLALGKAGGPIGVVAAALLAVVAAATAAIKVMWDLVAASREYSIRVTDIGTLIGATGQAQKDVSREIFESSLSWRFSLQQVADAYYNIASAILDVEKHQEMLNIVQATATANNADLASTTNAVTGLANAYGLEIDGVNKAVNWMSASISKGVTQFTEMSSAIPMLSTVAANAGISIEELFTMFAYLTKTGLGASEAVTQIRSAIFELINPSQDMIDLMREAGYESAAYMIQQEDFLGAWEIIVDKAGGNLEGLIGRKEAAAGLTALLTDEYKEFIPVMQEAAHESVNMKLATMENSDAFEILGTGLSNIKTQLGDELAPIINDVISRHLVGLMSIIMNGVIPALMQFANWTIVTAHRIIHAFNAMFQAIKGAVEVVAAPIRALVRLGVDALEKFGDTTSATYKSMKDFAEYQGLAHAAKDFRDSMDEVFIDSNALKVPDETIKFFRDFSAEDLLERKIGKATEDVLKKELDLKNRSFAVDKQKAKEAEDAAKKAAAAAKKAAAEAERQRKKEEALAKKKAKEEERKRKAEQRAREKAKRDAERKKAAEERAKRAARPRVSPKTINNYIAGNYYELGSSLFGGEGVNIADLLGGVGDGIPRPVHTGVPLPQRVELDKAETIPSYLEKPMVFNIYADTYEGGKMAAAGFEDQWKDIVRQGG